MEQGTRLDSTRMSAAQDVRDDTGPDHGLDAAVAALLTAPVETAGEGRAQTTRPPLPEPGSPEAKAMFHAACTETDRLSRDALHGYPELRRTDGSWWDRPGLNRALDAGEIAPAEYARLYRLAFERGHRIDAAALATDIGSLFALAFAEDYGRPQQVTDSSSDLPGDEFEKVQPPELLTEIAAEGLSLAHALIKYFGEGPIEKCLTTDIALRDHALRIRALGRNTATDLDAELIEIGRAWPGLVAEVDRATIRFDDATDACEVPEMPRELRVFNFDIVRGFPLPPQTRDGFAPYGLEQIEELRATPRMGVFIGGKPEGELLEGGGYRKVDPPAQKRAEAVIAAWDNWRSEIERQELAHDIPALRAAAQASIEDLDAAAVRARSIKAQTARGLVVKAGIAASLIPYANRDAEAATLDADDEAGILYTLVSDTLRVLGGNDPRKVRAS